MSDCLKISFLPIFAWGKPSLSSLNIVVLDFMPRYSIASEMVQNGDVIGYL